MTLVVEHPVEWVAECKDNFPLMGWKDRQVWVQEAAKMKVTNLQ